MKKRALALLTTAAMALSLIACTENAAPENPDNTGTPATASDTPAKVDYPKKPVEIFVTAPAGGSTDIVARAMGETAQEHLGQPIVVTNLVEAGGTVAMAKVKTSKPDGHTVICAPSGVFDTIPYFREVQYTLADFKPVIGAYTRELFFCVSADSPYQTFEEFRDAFKAGNKTVKYGAAGENNTTHLSQAALLNAAGLKGEVISLGGEANVFTNMIGGHIDAGYLHEGLTKQYIEEGLVRPLAIMSKESSRIPELSEIPNTTDLGCPEVDFSISNSYFVPKDTPDDVVAYMHDAFEKMMSEPAFTTFMEENSMGILTRAKPEDVIAGLEASTLKIKGLIDEMGVLTE